MDGHVMAMDEAMLAPDGTESHEAAEGEGPKAYFDLSDAELVAKIRSWLREASTKKAKQAPKRKLRKKMYAGDQWEIADVESAKAAKRPVLTLNNVLSMISALEGEERSNRQEIKFYGAGKEDDYTAAAMNKLLKWIDKGCGGEFAFSEMFRSGVISAESWIVPEVDYFDDPEGQIKLVHVCDEEIFDDPLSKDAVGRDSRFRHRVRMMTEDELEARWPGSCEKVRAHLIEDGYSRETDGKGYRDIYDAPENPASMKHYDGKEKLWSVVETWWYQIEAGAVVVNEQTGQLEEFTAGEFAEMKAQREREQVAAMNAALLSAQSGVPVDSPPPPLESQERPIRRFYQAFTCYDVLLAKQASPMRRLRRFPYVPFRCYWDGVNGDWFSPVDAVVDLQRQMNVEQSVITQMMQLQPKQAWMGPKGVFHNLTKWMTDLAKPGAILEFNAARGKPEPIPAPPIPRHMIDMAFSRPESMRAISGVNVELTGARQGNDAGVVMEQRRKAAKTVLAPLFDNFRHTKIEVGRVLLAYIQEYVSVGRRLRVIGPEGAEVVQMTTDMSIGTYDITVDETDSSVNDRVQTMNLLQTLLPTLAKTGLSLTPSMVDLIPMEPHVRDEMKRQLSWEMALSGRAPPPGWQPGMPVPMAAPTVPDQGSM